MRKVIVKAHKWTGVVSVQGRDIAVSVESQVLNRGWVSLIDPHDMKIDLSAPTMQLLKIKEPDMGEVYIDLTIDQWYALLNPVAQGGGGSSENVTTYEWRIGATGDIPAGNTVIMQALYNKEILDIELDGNNINGGLSIVGFFNPMFTANTGKIDFSTMGIVLTDNAPADLSLLKIIVKDA